MALSMRISAWPMACVLRQQIKYYYCRAMSKLLMCGIHVQYIKENCLCRVPEVHIYVCMVVISRGQHSVTIT